MLNSLSRCFALIAILALPSAPASAVTFDDGMLHVIDAANSYPAEDLNVYDGPAGEPTELLIVDGGEIGTIASGAVRIHETSELVMLGGTVGRGVHVSDLSQATISGGSISRGVTFAGNSTGQLSGAVFGLGDVTVHSDASVVVLGGVFASSGTVEASEGGDVEIFDGDFDKELRSGGISGTTSNSSRIRILGGHVHGYRIWAFLSGTVEILGGLIESPLLAESEGTILIVGSSFNYPFGPVS